MANYPGNEMRFWLKHFDNVPHVVVHTHGLAFLVNDNETGAGYKAGCGIFFGSGHPLNSSLVFEGRQTAQVAHLVAAVVALRSVKRNSLLRCVELRVNCSYLVKALCGKRDNWADEAWCAKQEQSSLLNLPLIRALYEEIDQFDQVLLTFVNQKNGGRGLLKAVQLAENALEEYTSKKETVVVETRAVPVDRPVDGGGDGPQAVLDGRLGVQGAGAAGEKEEEAVAK